jgi:hypothetical protein
MIVLLATTSVIAGTYATIVLTLLAELLLLLPIVPLLVSVTNSSNNQWQVPAIHWTVKS